MKKILLSLVLFSCLDIINAQTSLLDPSFGNNGLVTADLGTNFNYSNYGKQVLVQPNGSIYFVYEQAGATLLQKNYPMALLM